jgi:hypothetical protein
MPKDEKNAFGDGGAIAGTRISPPTKPVAQKTVRGPSRLFELTQNLDRRLNARSRSHGSSVLQEKVLKD